MNFNYENKEEKCWYGYDLVINKNKKFYIFYSDVLIWWNFVCMFYKNWN